MKTCSVCEQEVSPQMIRQGSALSRGTELFHRECQRSAQGGAAGRPHGGPSAASHGTSFPGIQVSVEYASFGRRLAAHFIDGFILTAGMLAVMIPLGVGTFMTAGASEAGIGAAGLIGNLIGLVLPVAYFIWFWSRNGATPGKRAVGIRVVNANDDAPSGVQSFVRYIGYQISAIPFCLGFLWMLWDSDKRCWHDMMSGTRVIRD